MIITNAISHTEHANENKYKFDLPMRVFSKRIQQVPIIVRAANFIIDCIKGNLSADERRTILAEISAQIIAATGAGKTMMFSAIIYLVTKYLRDNNIKTKSRNFLIATPWIALNSQTEEEIIRNIQSLNSDYAGKKYLQIFIQDSAEGRIPNFSNIFHPSTYANGEITTVNKTTNATPDFEFTVVVACNKSIPKVNGIDFLCAIADEAHRINGGIETNKLWFENVQAESYLYFTATRTISASLQYSMENRDKYGTLIGVISYLTAFNEGWILYPKFYCGEASQIRFDDNFNSNVKKKVSALLDETLHFIPIGEKHVDDAGGNKHKILVAADKAFACVDPIVNWGEYSFDGKYLVFVAISRTPAMSEIEGSGSTIYSVNGRIIKTREEWMRLIHLCKNCIVFNYDIFKEGINIPSFTTVMICRDLTDNKVAMVQYSGRAFRIDEGCEYLNPTQEELDFLGDNFAPEGNPNKVPQILYISEYGKKFFDEEFMKTKVFDNENYGHHGMEIDVEGGSIKINKNDKKDFQLIREKREWVDENGINVATNINPELIFNFVFGED